MPSVLSLDDDTKGVLSMVQLGKDFDWHMTWLSRSVLVKARALSDVYPPSIFPKERRNENRPKRRSHASFYASLYSCCRGVLHADWHTWLLQDCFAADRSDVVSILLKGLFRHKVPT